MKPSTQDRNAALSEANKEAFENLHQLLHNPMSNNVIAVVGAGVSIRAGYPSWNGLLNQMAAKIISLNPGFKEVVQKLGFTQDVLWRAEEYRRLLTEDRYLDLLRRTFSPPAGPIGDCLKNLVGMNFKHVLTTNYDKVLELAHFEKNKNGPTDSVPEIIDWTNQSDVREFMYRASSSDYSRRYVYLHGRYNDPKNIVLTDSDYTDRYLRLGEANAKLSALFSTFSIVFIGFSLSDPALNRLLQQVKISLGAGAPQHFALLGLNTEDEMLERSRLSGKYGVEPVFYQSSDGHEGMCDFIDSLSREEDGYPPEPPSLARPTMNPGSPGGDPNDPQKGLWGRESTRSGYSLSANVLKASTSSTSSKRAVSGRRLFDVTLTVKKKTSTPSSPVQPAANSNESSIARFHLHPTFVPAVRDVPFQNEIATLKLTSWGAFTVGVEILGTSTELELDLTTTPQAPRSFLSS